VSDKFAFALDTTVSNSSNFLTIKRAPATVIVIVIEIKDEGTVYEVDESIPHVTVVI
jgi:hypothetical protein